MKLYFQRSNDTYFFIKEVKDKADAVIEMHKFLKHYEYDSYYMREMHSESPILYYDVGSYTEFFILTINETIDEEFRQNKKIIEFAYDFKNMG